MEGLGCRWSRAPLLIYTSVVTTSRKAEEIYAQLDQLNTHHLEVENKLRRLRADVHLSGIYIRDYLLDTDREQAPVYRQRLTELRTLLPPDAAPRMNVLETRLDEYWEAFEPLFTWTLYEKVMRSGRFRVADDGTGIDPARARGMGLLGIEERARELRGAFHVASRAPQGTEIVVTLPVTIPVEEAPLARAAG